MVLILQSGKKMLELFFTKFIFIFYKTIHLKIMFSEKIFNVICIYTFNFYYFPKGSFMINCKAASFFNE